MATIDAASATARARPERTRFFSRSALLMLAMVILAFPTTYFAPVLAGSGKFAPIFHIHGIAFFTWIFLYAWQTHLVAEGRIARHREFGLAGVALSGIMVPLGFALAIAAIERRLANGDPHPFDNTLYNMVDIISFTLLMTASIASVTRHPDWHRRFTFAAATALVGPAISRWFYATPMPALPPFTDFAPNLIADLFLVALAAHDRRTLGRIHPVTLGCLIVMVPIHLLTPFAVSSAWWRSIAPGLLTMVKITPGMAG
ncbi:MAG: hypothetical protein ACTHJR_05625 [Sphingomonas sp.]|uniref:hypothetical protein n=1 Tax=Sphingomonas sp. TaxID=28214 RepID=UPI003F7FAF80